MTKFIHYLQPVIGHQRPKYVILLNYRANNSEIPHSFVKIMFINCNCIFQLEKGTCLPFTLWTCSFLRLKNFVEVYILRHAKQGGDC